MLPHFWSVHRVVHRGDGRTGSKGHMHTQPLYEDTTHPVSDKQSTTETCIDPSLSREGESRARMNMNITILGIAYSISYSDAFCSCEIAAEISQNTELPKHRCLFEGYPRTGASFPIMILSPYLLNQFSGVPLRCLPVQIRSK